MTKLSFETLPVEIRFIIYDYCLIHHEEIVPFPTGDEFLDLENDGFMTVHEKERWPEILSEYQDTGDQNYHDNWPCIALLGVNKKIREEAARILFGKNIWRLSDPTTLSLEDESKRQPFIASFYEVHASHFRHIRTRFQSKDIPRHGIKAALQKDRSGPDAGDRSHYEQPVFEWAWDWKLKMLRTMKLQTLTLDTLPLTCSMDCSCIQSIQDICRDIGLASVTTDCDRMPIPTPSIKASIIPEPYTSSDSSKQSASHNLVGASDSAFHSINQHASSCSKNAAEEMVSEPATKIIVLAIPTDKDNPGLLDAFQMPGVETISISRKRLLTGWWNYGKRPRISSLCSSLYEETQNAKMREIRRQKRLRATGS